MMRKIEKTVFVTSDDEEFTDKAAAAAHEVRLENAAHVERFLDEQHDESHPRDRSRKRNLILAYLAWAAPETDTFGDPL